MKNTIGEISIISKKIGITHTMFKNIVNKGIEFSKKYDGEYRNQVLSGFIFYLLNFNSTYKISDLSKLIFELIETEDLRKQSNKHIIFNQFNWLINCN